MWKRDGQIKSLQDYRETKRPVQHKVTLHNDIVLANEQTTCELESVDMHVVMCLSDAGALESIRGSCTLLLLRLTVYRP